MRLALVLVAGCSAIPIPPMMAMHADTDAAARGTTSVVVVVGMAGPVFGGGGYGVAVRAERQVTTRTTLGLELTAGSGNETRSGDAEPIRRWLIAGRGYGRWNPRSHDWIATTYGLGISYFSTGLVTGSANTGIAASYINDYAIPVAQLALAGALPLRRGEPFGDATTNPRRPDHDAGYPKPDLFICVEGGLIVPLAATASRSTVRTWSRCAPTTSSSGSRPPIRSASIREVRALCSRMFWFPVIAAGAAAAVLGKRLARYFNGQLAHSAVHDPVGVRTRVRFELDPGEARQLLGAVAAAITPIVEPSAPLEVSAAAVRGGEVDILRLAPCTPGTYTLTLTRAWTGAQLNAAAVEVLERLHDVLARVPVRGLAWFARQDRGFAAAYPYPFDP